MGMFTVFIVRKVLARKRKSARSVGWRLTSGRRCMDEMIVDKFFMLVQL